MQTRSMLAWGAAISMVAYLICLTLPALDVRGVAGQVQTSSGASLALSGVAAVFSGNFAWLANCVLIVAWLLAFVDKSVHCLYFSLLAFFLSLHTFRFNFNAVPDKSSCCLLIENFQAGFYFWLASILIMLVMALLAMVEMRLTPTTPSEHG